jgi:DNA-binding NtrC family response regulator
MARKEPQLIHILLVDDEASVLAALKLLLQAIGFKVTEFVDSDEALQYLRDGGECDLFICDRQMRFADGFKVLERTKKVRPSLPFILMSGAVTDEESALAYRQGAAGFLAKPFSPDEVKELVARVVPRT